MPKSHASVVLLLGITLRTMKASKEPDCLAVNKASKGNKWGRGPTFHCRFNVYYCKVLTLSPLA